MAGEEKASHAGIALHWDQWAPTGENCDLEATEEDASRGIPADVGNENNATVGSEKRSLFFKGVF